MNVKFEKAFLKDISKLKKKSVKQKILKIIDGAKLAKSKEEIKHLKKLVGFSAYYRIKVNKEYRIGIELTSDELIFACFSHRKDIYKKFP